MSELRHVKGLSELKAALQSFSKKLRDQAIGSAVNAAAAVVRDQARLNAPLYHGNVSEGHPPPGTLRKDIIMKRIPEKTNLTRVTDYVLVRKGQHLSDKQLIAGKVARANAYYWWWVEFGTAKMEGVHFMTKAFNTKKYEAIDAFAADIRPAIARAAAKST